MDSIFCIYLNVCLINNSSLYIINFTRTRHTYSSVCLLLQSSCTLCWNVSGLTFFVVVFTIDEIVALLTKNPQWIEICQIWIKMIHKKYHTFGTCPKSNWKIAETETIILNISSSVEEWWLCVVYFVIGRSSTVYLWLAYDIFPIAFIENTQKGEMK